MLRQYACDTESISTNIVVASRNTLKKIRDFELSAKVEKIVLHKLEISHMN